MPDESITSTSFAARMHSPEPEHYTRYVDPYLWLYECRRSCYFRFHPIGPHFAHSFIIIPFWAVRTYENLYCKYSKKHAANANTEQSTYTVCGDTLFAQVCACLFFRIFFLPFAQRPGIRFFVPTLFSRAYINLLTSESILFLVYYSKLFHCSCH